MALKSVVVAPPSAPAVRPTKVLRAGPPQPGGLRDILVGVVGLMVLVAAVAMAYQLPEREVLPPQFKITYLNSDKVMPSQNASFLEVGAEKTKEFRYTLPDSVHRIKVDLSLEDDNPASEPDNFMLQLYDPQGNQIGPDVLRSTAPTTQDAQNFTYVPADGVADVVSFTPGAKPDDTVVEAAPGASAQQVQDEKAKEAMLPTAGEWVLRVTLLAAGDCATPTAGTTLPTQDQIARRAVCEQRSPGGTNQGRDLGNSFTVGSFTYTSFDVIAEQLD